MHKWRGLSPLNYTGAGVITNEGKPGRPPGLQLDGCSEPIPGDAADTKQTRAPDDGHDEFDVVYNPITETNPRQSDVYNLLKVDEAASVACVDKDGTAPIDFIPTAEAKSVAQGLTDPANDDTTVTLKGRDNTNRRDFYDLLMAVGGMNLDSIVWHEVHKNES